MKTSLLKKRRKLPLLATLLLLASLMAPMTIWGQQTLVVANGTATNSKIPFYGLYADDNYQHTQTIYPSTMLTAMQGGTITKLTYHLSSSVTKDYGSTFEVRLGTTSSTSFSTGTVNYISMTGSPAYSNTLSVNGTTVEFNLSTPYTYNGGNLVVDVRITSLVNIYSGTSFLGESGSTNYSVQKDSSSEQPPYTQGSSVTFMPKTTFTYLPSTPYITLAPTAATVLTGFTQTLTATYGNVSGTPTITYSSSNTNVATVSGSGTTATVTGVADGTATITASMTVSGVTYSATSTVTVESCGTIGTGTSTSNRVPINNYYNYFTTQSLYTASEINAAIGSNSIIESLSFYHNANSATYSINIYLAHTTQTALAANAAVTSAELVYTGSDITVGGSTAGWQTFELDTPFQYNGADNLLVIVSGTGSYSTSLTWTNTTVSNSVLHRGNDNTSGYADLSNGHSTYNYTLANTRPNIKICGSAPTSSCDKTIPYTYGFEDATDYNDCWINDNLEECSSNSNMGGGVYTSSSYANNGSNLFIFSSYCGETDPQYLISPELTGVTNGVHVEFYYAIADFASGAPETFQVGYSTTNNSPSSFTWVESKTCTTYTYQHFSANYTGNVKYIAVKYTTADSYYLFLDDFTITELPSCLEPTNVTASNETTTSASISWTAGGSETAWDLYYTTSSTEPTSSTPPSISGISSTSQNLTGLSPATTYYVYVRSSCGGSDKSEWSDVCIFNTECNGMSLPYTETFESGALTVCWTPINESPVYMGISVVTTDPYAGTYHLDLDRRTPNGTQIVVLPEVDDSYVLNNYEVSFYARLDGGSDYTTTGRTLAVGVMTDPDDASTFVQVGSIISPTDTYAQYSVDLSSYTGNGHYIAIQHYSTSGNNGYTFIDNLEVNALPCSVPAGLSATNVTSSGATLSWTGDQSTYNVRYRTVTISETTTTTTEGFEHGGDMPDGWTKLDLGDGNNTSELGIYNGSGVTHDGTYCFRFSSFSGSSSGSFDQYLISPELNNLSALSFYYRSSSTSTSGETFRVGYSTTTNDVSAFTWVSNGSTSSTSYTQFTASDIPANAKYFAINYTAVYQYRLYIDDITYTYTPTTYGAWNTSNTNVTSPLSLTGLTPSTTYEWQVQGVDSDCSGGITDWSAPATFTTLEAYTITLASSTNGTINSTTPASPVGAGTTVTVSTTPDSGYHLSTLYYTTESSPTTQVAITNGSFTMPADNITIYAVFGSNDLHYVQSGNNVYMSWDEFTYSVQNTTTYSGKIIYLDKDITVTNIVPGIPWQTSKAFWGTFDGQCHTITINHTATQDYTGLFRYTYGATIKNLKLEGAITSEYNNTASFIGLSQATTNIENCISNVTISSTANGVAGMVANASNNINFRGCAFTGSLVGTSNDDNGGFVGHQTNNGTHTFTNCLFDPTSVSSNMTNCYTFDSYNDSNDNHTSSFTNCYYTQAFGTAQGKQAYTITGDGVTVAMSGTPTEYSCSGIVAYTPGMVYDDNIIAGDGDAVALTLSTVDPAGTYFEGYDTSNGTLSTSGTPTGTNDAYTLTMSNGNAVITVKNALPTWVTEVTEAPSGFLLSNIDSPEDLAWVISLVNGYNGVTADATVAKNVTITADLDMSAHTWVPIGEGGTPYLGTFDGNFHTISGLHIAADEEAAAGNKVNTGLFGLTDNNATIKNLYVKDAEFVNSNVSGNLGGIVGSNGGTVQNCYSDATLGGTATNKGGIAGANTGTLSNSYTMVTSGVCGSNSETISHCYNKAETNSSPSAGEFTEAVAYTYGDYTTNNAAKEGTTLKPMVDWLNTSNPDAANVKWIRPKGSLKINDGYPVLVEASTDTVMAVVGVTNDKNIYKGEANAMIGNATYDVTGADIYIYGGGTLTTKPTNASLFIDEDASIKLDGVSDVVATVGVTMDNSKGTNDGDMLLGRDWHCFATPLANAHIGMTYPDHSEAYGQSTVMVENQHYVVSTATNSYLAGLAGNSTELDYYDFYEPQYHWINLKRPGDSHWQEDSPTTPIDYDQGSTMQSGRGYLIAVGDNSTAKRNVYLSAKGTLKDGDVTATVTNKGEHLTGYNFLGNPYQSYLDFNKFASVEANAKALWSNTEAIGYKSYLIYDADQGGFVEYLVDNSSKGFSQGAEIKTNALIHPHQSFFVVKNSTTNDTETVTFTNDMRVTDTTGYGLSAYRSIPSYPLVNLICTDSDGKREVSVIEVERPSMAGALKMKEMLNAKANMYVRWGSEDFSSMFIDHTPDYVPVWFKSVEEGVFTMTWSTANDNFGYLHLIDNLTGNDIDMLATDSYAFQSRPSDSKARFRLVFSPLGIDEETSEQGENFAFINGSELVVTGEGELSLIDLNGRVLTTEYVSGQQSHIAMPRVAVGMYMLRLSNSDGVKVQKIVVRK